MNYDDMVTKAIYTNDTNEAQIFAMLAIADRLDRLCKLMSRGN